MGSAKALLSTGEGPLFATIARQLQECFSAVRPIGTLEKDLPDFPGLKLLPAVPDVLPERSSLNGVLTALENSTKSWVGIFACDAPHISIPLLQHMAGLRRGEADLIAAVDQEGEIQPFHALWHTRCAPVLRDAAERGELSLSKVIGELSVIAVPAVQWRAFDPSGEFLRNLNTPADLAAFTHPG